MHKKGIEGNGIERVFVRAYTVSGALDISARDDVVVVVVAVCNKFLRAAAAAPLLLRPAEKKLQFPEKERGTVWEDLDNDLWSKRRWSSVRASVPSVLSFSLLTEKKNQENDIVAESRYDKNIKEFARRETIMWDKDSTGSAIRYFRSAVPYFSTIYVYSLAVYLSSCNLPCFCGARQ